MKKYKGFEEEKKIYIGKVLNHIHYKKLHTRIYQELSDHLDDMYDDLTKDIDTFSDNEEIIVKKIFDEMGDPDDLGKELKEANKKVLFWAKLCKRTLIIVMVYFCIVCLPFIVDNFFSNLNEYFNAVNIETMEIRIVEQDNDGEPIKLLAEAESHGIVYKFYVPEKEPEDEFIDFETTSIKAFGINFKNKFAGHGRGYQNPKSNVYIYNLHYENELLLLHDSLFVFIGKPEEKYIRVYFEPINRDDEEHKPYWSELIEYPQNGTYENPVTFVLECPEGYRWNVYESLDENKQKIEYKSHSLLGQSHDDDTVSPPAEIEPS